MPWRNSMRMACRWWVSMSAAHSSRTLISAEQTCSERTFAPLTCEVGILTAHRCSMEIWRLRISAMPIFETRTCATRLCRMLTSLGQILAKLIWKGRILQKQTCAARIFATRNGRRSGYKTGQRIWDQERARRLPELGDPKRRSLHRIGHRMAGAACTRVNQYEYLTSIGARVLLPAEKV